MQTIFSCQCADGRTVSGTPRWLPDDLRRMQPLQLAAVAAELKAFAGYYNSHFSAPLNRLEKEASWLRETYKAARMYAILLGIASAISTIVWIVFAVLGVSGLALLFALLTLVSILAFVPFLLRYLSAQADYEKRLPRTTAKLEQLKQKKEQLIFGTYLDYVIGAYFFSQEFGLCEQALDYMAQCLSSRRACNLAEANLLCRKKYGRSSVPRIVIGIQQSQIASTDTDRTEPAAEAPRGSAPPKKSAVVPVVPPEDSTADLQSLIQLSEYLAGALHQYAAEKTSSGSDGGAMRLSEEEAAFLAEFRALTDQERLRIRRIVRSFRTGTI